MGNRIQTNHIKQGPYSHVNKDTDTKIDMEIYKQIYNIDINLRYADMTINVGVDMDLWQITWRTSFIQDFMMITKIFFENDQRVSKQG